MKQRSLGRCGIMIGEVGLGCEGLLGKSDAYINQALDMMAMAGANGIDLYSPNPQMRSACLTHITGFFADAGIYPGRNLFPGQNQPDKRPTPALVRKNSRRFMFFIIQARAQSASVRREY